MIEIRIHCDYKNRACMFVIRDSVYSACLRAFVPLNWVSMHRTAGGPDERET